MLLKHLPASAGRSGDWPLTTLSQWKSRIHIGTSHGWPKGLTSLQPSDLDVEEFQAK